MDLKDHFIGIEGQSDAVMLLVGFVQKRRIPSAFLFHGPQGVGKMLTAKRFAQSALCRNLPEESHASNQCPSCRKALQLTHPDILIHENPGKIIRISEIRDYIMKLNLKAFESHAKFLIINDAENMNAESSNALLKTLEEPPENTHIILVTSNLNEILPTIKSRCVKIRFRPLAPEDVELLLQREAHLPQTKAAEISLLASGSMQTALELADETNYAVLKSLAESVIGLLEIKDFDPEKMVLVTELFDKRQEKEKLLFPKLLDILYLYWRDMLILNAGIEAKRMFVAPGKVFNIKPAPIFKLMDLIQGVRKDLEINVNLRLAIESLVLEMRKVIENAQEQL
jgi:DNA polymerase-3 subunit delta'